MAELGSPDGPTAAFYQLNLGLALIDRRMRESWCEGLDRDRAAGVSQAGVLSRDG